MNPLYLCVYLRAKARRNENTPMNIQRSCFVFSLRVFRQICLGICELRKLRAFAILFCYLVFFCLVFSRHNPEFYLYSWV